MSEPKVQLVDPQGNVNLPGMNATGVITATSFSGSGGVINSLTGNPNLNVGVVTATSFVGDGTGHAANLTGTPNLNLGLTTATSFIGDATGKAAGLTGTPNLNVGLITATSFAGDVTGNVSGNVSGNLTGNITGDVTGNITGDVTGNITGNIDGNVEGDVTGNVSGLARGLGISANGVWTGAGTSQINAGVVTAIQYHGDGSGLTGAGSSASIAQEITAIGPETIIDLSDGNLIYYQGKTTTVGFASTSPAEQITIIRPKRSEVTSASFTTGGVTLRGDPNDSLEVPDDNDLDFGTGAFTIEFFIKTTAPHGWVIWKNVSDNGIRLSLGTNGDNSADYNGIIELNEQVSNNDSYIRSTKLVNDGKTHHVAFARGAAGSTTKLWVDGLFQAESSTNSRNFDNSDNLEIGCNQGAYGFLDGVISNLRIVKGTAVYTGTSDFTPPTAALTNITNTVLLCCQSDSSATAATVIPTGSITVTNGAPAAGSLSVNYTFASGVVTWPDRIKWSGVAAPIMGAVPPNNVQVLHLTTYDTGLTYNGWEELQLDPPTSLWTWGTQQRGQMGTNSRLAVSSPVQVPSGTNTATWSTMFTVGPPGATDRGVRSWIRTDGTLWSAGYNTRGGLGQNNLTTQSSPVQIPGSWASGNIGGDSYNGIHGIKADGTLWGWGQNEDGYLGTNQAHDLKVSSPIQIGTDSTWSAIRGGSCLVVALKTNGTLWTWGAGEAGGLGQNQPVNTKRSSPTQVGTDTTWTSNFNITHGDTIVAGKSDGTLWSWGNNQDGQMAFPISPAKRYRSSPTQVGTKTDWSGSKVGEAFASFGVVKADGTLWTWGRGSQGQNMLNNSSPTESPVQVGSGTNWAYYSGSYYHALACKTDGTLWAVGNNDSGAFGIPSIANGTQVSSPVQVDGNGWVGTTPETLTTDLETQTCFRTPTS